MNHDKDRTSKTAIDTNRIRSRLKIHGLFRGVVINDVDPAGKKRLQVTVPDVFHDDYAVWAMPCIPNQDAPVLPVGSGAWIMFERGNADYPVWMGTGF